MKKFDLLKYLMLLLVGMAFALNASAARGQWVLQLWDRDGAKVGQYALTMSPTVTFTEDQVVVTNDVADVYYHALPTMWKFTYFFDPGSGIKDITAENNAMTFDGNVIIFPALKAGANIMVYGTNGSLVMSKTVATDGEYAFPLSDLTKGVYLVNENGQTYKIVKK